jgi:translation elongation factor P/translation initiation factor 5A
MATAADLERGKFFDYKGEILEVTRKELVNCGTHSHTKLKLSVRDITGKRERVVTFAHNDKVDMIDVMKKTGTVVSKTASAVQIMDGQSYETLDAKGEPDVMASLSEGDEVLFLDMNGDVRIIGKKFN